MKRILCSVVGTCLAGSALIAVADTNQMVPATQPTTQPMLDGKVLSTSTAISPTTPPEKPPVFSPNNPGDGGGNKPTGLLLNGGIGATISPGSGGGITVPSAQGIGQKGNLTGATTRPMGR